MKQVLVITALSVSMLFGVAYIQCAPETVGEIPNIVTDRPLEEITFVSILEKLQHVESLLPYAQKEQAARCPNRLRRLISRQTDAEKTLCTEARQVVKTLQTSQEALKQALKYDFEYKRCGDDEACQEKVKEQS